MWNLIKLVHQGKLLVKDTYPEINILTGLAQTSPTLFGKVYE